MSERYVNGIAETIINVKGWQQKKIAAVVTAVEVSQNAVVQMAQKLVPVVTGNLQDSIKAGDVTVTQKYATGTIIANAEYASFVEYGAYNLRSGKYNKAKPYLRPAIIAKRGYFRRLVAQALAGR